jgi:hypothetical protein
MMPPHEALLPAARVKSEFNVESVSGMDARLFCCHRVFDYGASNTSKLVAV